MFAKTIIDSDAFIEMPISARLLYYDLGMRADDDGFVNSPKKIMRMIGATIDDMNILIMRKFIIPFDSGVVVIKHWRINNYLRSDRYTETQYVKEKEQLTIDDKGKYHLGIPTGIPHGVPTVSTGKDSIGKDSIGYLSNTNVLDCPSGDGRYSEIVEAWNGLSVFGVAQVKRIVDGSIRAKQLKSRISQYGEDAIIEAIDRIRRSKFLQGDNNRGWIITFDWFIKPSNFAKVYEGNYDNTAPKQADNKYTQKLVDIGEWGKQFEQQD